MSSSFLFNGALWDVLGNRIPKAKVVRAAVAYLGSGASRLLPLKKGDKLVVDMSLRAVKSGSTDPREVRKFLRKEVEVFSRGSLHAKFFVIDRSVIAGSSNISKHARNGLDEAAILTDDPATVRRASTTFELLCTEPVRKDYLRKCIKEYRPPKFAGRDVRPGPRRNTLTCSKVWLIGGLTPGDVPEDEQGTASRIIKRAARKKHDFERCEVIDSNYPARQRFFSLLRPEDWLILCIENGRGFDVWAPARFHSIESYPRGGGKRRYLLLYEMPTDAETISWSSFRKQCGAVGLGSRPRTRPILSDVAADRMLRLWDARGRLRRSKA